MQTQSPLVVFAHGKESGPWGSKIKHLAAVAQGQGYAVQSPDYSHTHDPKERLDQLLRSDFTVRPLVLAGSSMGGYVSAMACAQLKPAALFLMAPALYFDQYSEEPEACPADTVVVQGWRDDVVPPERAIRFARQRCAQLHLVDDGHRLSNSLDTLGRLFAEQLQRVLAG